jgi:putative AdoMet-dependent methyltransferase
MRSQFADKFNHDDDALKYDRDVLNESDPIRAGYEDLLNWVAAEASTCNNSIVLDLGSGTGNLSLRLKPFKELVCVDISKEMLQLAQNKLSSFNNITWYKEDILEYFYETKKTFDIIVSTYAIHHLTEVEKGLLFKKIGLALNTSGKVVFGDLMFENETKKEKFVKTCLHSGREKLAEDIDDEFFWNVESASKILRNLRFRVNAKQFSELSWGIAARKTG